MPDMSPGKGWGETAATLAARHGVTFDT